MTGAEAVIEALTKNTSSDSSLTRLLKDVLLAYGSDTEDNHKAIEQIKFKDHKIRISRWALSDLLWKIEDMSILNEHEVSAMRIAILIISALEERHKEQAES